MARSWILSLAIVLTGFAAAEAQQSRCADCHIANPQSDPYPEHLYDWEMSAHGRNDVGCDRCHGGDPTTFESFLAHKGILTSRNPASPTYPTNLPQTCGACHTGPFVQFQNSRHYQLLREGSTEGPTCSTCHGPVAARLLSPRRLQSQCQTCHGPEGVAPQPDFGPEARILLEQTQAIRDMLRPVPDLIRRIDDENRKRDLQEAYEQAQVPLTEAVYAGHAFVFENMQERLDRARARSEALLEELANP